MADCTLRFNSESDYVELIEHEAQKGLGKLLFQIEFLEKTVAEDPWGFECLNKKKLLDDEYPILGGDSITMVFRHYTKESLEDFLNSNNDYLKSSYLGFLEKFCKIKESNMDKQGKITQFKMLEKDVSEAMLDIIELNILINYELGTSYYNTVHNVV